MAGYNVKNSGLERAEDGLVHCSPIHAEMSHVVVVEHQGHEIDTLCREFGRNGSFYWSRDGDDRCQLDAVTPELAVTFGRDDRRGTPQGRRHRRCRSRRGARVAVAL